MKLSNILLSFLVVSALEAEDTFGTKFNYFGNVSAAKLNAKGFNLNDYSHNSVDSKLSFSPYSKVGAQLSLYTENFTFTAQGLIKKTHESSKFEFTWLNLKYDLNDRFSLRFGRIQTKVLLHSESLDINNLQVWAKPPVEVYRLMPVRTYDGIELTYDNNFAQYHLNVSAVGFGRYKDKINGNKNVETDIFLEESHSLTFTLDNDIVRYKASYSRTHVDIEDDLRTKQVVDALRVYGNNMDRFTYSNRRVGVYSLGFQYMGDSLLIDAEAVASKTDGLLPSSRAAYMMLGYKLDNFTPYIIYAKNQNDKSFYNTDSIQTPDATSRGLKRGLDDILYLGNFSQSTVSLGTRYDIQAGMALNIQVDRISSTNYGSISSNTVKASGYEKVGILSRDAGTEDKAIYNFIMNLNFAY